MNIEIHGAGRAGGALAIAAVRAGHRIVGITSRTPRHVEQLALIVPVGTGTADLRIIAVRDDAVAEVATALADAPPVPTVHLSGSLGLSALAPIGDMGTPIGSFHPLQSLPDPETGADSLRGSWVGITATEPLSSSLRDLARSIGCIAFDLPDEAKPLYHAAASAVANFTVACLGVGERLFGAAGVPFAAAEPLVRSVVANAFTIGPASALTGPIARGDVETVRRQRAAVEAVEGDVQAAFRALAMGTARFAGAPDDVIEAIE
jgi:predicted short-subunit dehydrogenase-like oxidoreductase (DUF2520 family)